MTSNPTNNPHPPAKLADPARELITLNIVTGALDLMGASAATDLLTRYLRGVPRELMADQLNQRVWESCLDMHAAGIVPNLPDLRLRPELSHVPVERWDAIEQAADGVSLQEQLNQLSDLARRRAVYQAGHRAQEAAISGKNLGETVAAEAQQLTQALTLGGTPRIKRRRDVAGALAYAAAQQAGGIRDLTTGLAMLDAQLGGGILLGTLTIIAAASGRGKTRAALRMSLANAVKGEKTLYVSGEMKSLDVPDYLAGWEGRVDADGQRAILVTHDIYNALELMASGVTRSGKGKPQSADERRRLAAAEQWMLATDMISVYDDDFTLDTIASLAFSCQRDGTALMVIDNLTHLTRSGSRRTTEADEHQWYKTACEQIAAIARMTGVAIVVLLQPSSNKEISDGKAPREYEMGASRAVVHGASYVITMGRDVNGVQEAWRTNDGTTEAQAYVMKCRYRGGQGVLGIKYSDRYGLWYGHGDGEPGAVVDLTAYLDPHLEVSA